MMHWDTGAISEAVEYRVADTDGNIQSILYENEPFLGTPTEVFAYVGVPASVDGSVPGMVCVHGGGGRAFREWVEMWVERGYAAIAMDLNACGEDRQRQTLSCRADPLWQRWKTAPRTAAPTAIHANQQAHVQRGGC